MFPFQAIPIVLVVLRIFFRCVKRLSDRSSTEQCTWAVLTVIARPAALYVFDIKTLGRHGVGYKYHPSNLILCAARPAGADAHHQDGTYGCVIFQRNLRLWPKNHLHCWRSWHIGAFLHIWMPWKHVGYVKNSCVGIGTFPWVWCRLLCPEHQFNGIFLPFEYG